MNRIIVLTFLVMLIQEAYAQPVTTVIRKEGTIVTPASPSITSLEICDNNIDDDNNQLVDQDDFGCYFNPASAAGCRPNSIIWGNSNEGDLYWINMTSGVLHLVGRSFTFGDITWASDGRLYGLRGDIWEIDPATGVVSGKGPLPGGYSGSNAMTADNAGNLYLVASLSPSQHHIIKLNLASWQVCFIVNLSNANLSSAGDLTFLKGYLYLSCGANKIAKINVQTGALETKLFNNAPTPGFYGLTNTGDGYLYASDKDKLYRIDPATMTAETAPAFNFNIPGMELYGITAYAEGCHAQQCTGKITIHSNPGPPYCVGKPIDLLASTITGCGIQQGVYTWTTPSGTVIHNSKINATEEGMYYVSHRLATDTCTITDSILVKRQAIPVISLGPDTSMCNDGEIDLFPRSTIGFTSFKWQDGSTGPSHTALSPGWYWIDAQSPCGIVRDSIYIAEQTSGCETSVFIPTAFTPNDDGLNDVFKAEVIGNLSRFSQYELIVYNRWGQSIFRSRDLSRGWNGRIGGIKQTTDIFTWTCRYKLGRSIRFQKGTLTLIR